MAKFLKVILFLILAAAFCGSVSDAFTVQTVDAITIAAQTGLGEEGNAQRNDVRQGSYIPAPQLPYLSDAELASSAGTIQSFYERIYYVLTCTALIYNRIYPFIKRHDRAAGSS